MCYVLRNLLWLFASKPVVHKVAPIMQEMASQRLQVSKFPGGACPQTPLEEFPIWCLEPVMIKAESTSELTVNMMRKFDEINNCVYFPTV